ncbi:MULTISPECIES: hypothetical protein [unclassified Tolypothrix]|uniref:hypothetical protein n=1 Tax=unclassified Tolypothrix TaxID=2649714 RepID=UPI0012D82A34|nr:MULTISPECIES: hypothetical protein [unclassified Tolypothrix]MBE9086128.1 hypothetical protein [Tolypothrix sp. LEGE 11397]UYD28474.1 hypothetical protein HGR01_10795 [Tolypothrix sp. PCC 7712]UYD35615.1 hypothetical protein HG267_07585 [Tolypothrix sp. PCC 7601]
MTRRLDTEKLIPLIKVSYKKLHPQGDGVFGHWELGIGETVPWAASPTCTPALKQATRSVSDQRGNCRRVSRVVATAVIGKKIPMPYAQCPKRRGCYPSPPTRGWSFPPLSIKVNKKNP